MKATETYQPFSQSQNFAAGLDSRRCIWWGVLCAWDVMRDNFDAEVQPAFDLCVRWHHEPTEEIRRRAGDWAEAKQFSPAVNTLLRAIFFTGSIAPINVADVMADQSIVKRFVAASMDLMLADIALPNQGSQAIRFESILKQMGR